VERSTEFPPLVPLRCSWCASEPASQFQVLSVDGSRRAPFSLLATAIDTLQSNRAGRRRVALYEHLPRDRARSRRPNKALLPRSPTFTSSRPYPRLHEAISVCAARADRRAVKEPDGGTPSQIHFVGPRSARSQICQISALPPVVRWHHASRLAKAPQRRQEHDRPGGLSRR
jgi:hypothetical protein